LPGFERPCGRQAQETSRCERAGGADCAQPLRR
jgi:hypothetical protein